MAKYTKGSVHPSELQEFEDSQTGAHIYQLTNDTTINHNLYFLTPSFTPDQSHLIFTSYRSGKANFFKLEFPNGDIVQLTNGEEVHGYSGVIAKDGKELFYTEGDSIKAIHLDTLAERVLAEFPGGSLGECSVSADEQFIVTAMKRDNKSHITVTATDGSGGEIIYTSPNQTIIHPQFHPKHADLIAYSGDPAPRMWTIKRDGTENRMLYQHDNNEFLVHETFLGSQDELIVTHWPYSLRRISLGTLQIQTISDFNAWHIASNRAGTKVLCDTVHPDIGLRLVDVETGEHVPICYPQSSSSGSQWKKDRYAVAEDWAAAQQAGDREKSLSWMEMKVDTVYGPQWTHPHPSFSPDETAVVYTSDVSGHSQVYVAVIP
ncbi:MAG: oligogalacturonate lyase family protein [Candidatus Poribacteria bacterium]|nr:oligogalacturonate lyase family protein [Candidatus Poribacteria bacterium]